MSLFVILGAFGELILLLLYLASNVLQANSEEPDQMSSFMVTELGLQCLHITQNRYPVPALISEVRKS